MKKTTAHCRGMGILVLLLLTTLLSFSQNNFKVTGKVTDESGKALEGATVEEKGTKNTTITNQAGEFQLNVLSPKAKLTITYVGHEPMEIAVANQTSLSVTLKPAT